MTRIIFIVLTLFFIPVLAQDGSDIQYLNIEKVDSSLIGEFIQLDFRNRSFGSFARDTVSIAFKGFSDFKEIRNDNGFNNWFHEQYLESIEIKDGLKLRIQKMKLLNISKDSIKVKLFGHLFENEEEVFSPFLIDTLSFYKGEIVEVLLDRSIFRREGIEVYEVYHSPKDSTKECIYCFEANEENLFSDPILSDYMIDHFDFGSQRIILNQLGKSEIKKLNIPLKGLPVALTLNGEVLYEFWLWNIHSSFGCDRVYTYPKLDFAIRFGLPESDSFGEDPRFNAKLKKFLNEE